MTPKPFEWPKNIHIIIKLPKYSFFYPPPPKIFIEIQEFEPQKWPEPMYVWKYQSTPPPGPVYMSTKYRG